MSELSKYFDCMININGTETLIVKKGFETDFIKSDLIHKYLTNGVIDMLSYYPILCDKYNLYFGILCVKTDYKIWYTAVLCMYVDGEFHHVFYKDNWICRECRFDNGSVLMPYFESDGTVKSVKIPYVFNRVPCKNCGKTLQNHIMFLP